MFYLPQNDSIPTYLQFIPPVVYTLSLLISFFPGVFYDDAMKARGKAEREPGVSVLESEREGNGGDGGVR